MGQKDIYTLGFLAGGYKAVAQFKGLDLENISASDKKKFRINYGVKIKDINNERLNVYANDLKGGIILSIGNIKAIDVESVSKALSNLEK